MANRYADDGMIQLCGLWRKKGKNGVEFLKGTLGGAMILMFPNKFKSEDSHPDFRLYIGRKPSERSGGRNEYKGKQQKTEDRAPAPDEAQADDDDNRCPF